jgi:hypothetical protein
MLIHNASDHAFRKDVVSMCIIVIIVLYLILIEEGY